jgi:hypothetical protein
MAVVNRTFWVVLSADRLQAQETLFPLVGFTPTVPGHRCGACRRPALSLQSGIQTRSVGPRKDYTMYGIDRRL